MASHSHGGSRRGAGRPLGVKQQMTAEALRRAGEGMTPLEYMLGVMRDASVEKGRRDRMAAASAPYMHAKAVEITGADGGPVQYGWDLDEWPLLLDE